MSTRKPRLIDCAPRWGSLHGQGPTQFVTFECPEGHNDCRHAIPFTPTLNGASATGWERTGDTFDTLTLSPSIKRQPVINSETGEVIDACEVHVILTNGVFTFCDDSR